jgi:hypothetical protein
MKAARLSARLDRALHRAWRWRFTGLVAIGVTIVALLALGFQLVVAIFWGFMVGLGFETLHAAARDYNPTLAVLHTLSFLVIIFGLIGLGMII